MNIYNFYCLQTKFGARYCFYMCLSVHREGGLCIMSLPIWLLVPCSFWEVGGGVSGQGLSVCGCLCPGESVGVSAQRPPRWWRACGIHPTGLLSCYVYDWITIRSIYAKGKHLLNWHSADYTQTHTESEVLWHTLKYMADKEETPGRRLTQPSNLLLLWRLRLQTFKEVIIFNSQNFTLAISKFTWLADPTNKGSFTLNVNVCAYVFDKLMEAMETKRKCKEWVLYPFSASTSIFSWTQY